MNGFYFEPRRNRGELRHDRDDSAPGLISLPAAVLERHGARVLDPEHAVEIPGHEPPRPTVYRSRTLLVPGDVIKNQPDAIRAVNAVLAGVGMELVTPPVPSDDRELRRANKEIAGTLLTLPRVAVLKPARLDGQPVHPQVVDAWVALQALREAVASKPRGWTGWLSRGQLDQRIVERFALEHILISSSIAGSPARHGPGGLAGGPGDGDGVTGPTSTDSYVFRGGDTRMPVAVCLDAPRRLSLKECVDKFGRRPVVAVPDLGVREHDWLDVGKWTGKKYPTEPNYGFVAVDDDIQKAIGVEGEFARKHGDRQRQVIWHPWDRPITDDPLVGEIESDTGHGTFISGIVRQVAPDARVLAVRVMHGDGLVYEGDLLCGLRELAGRIALAEVGQAAMARMVDVISLSLGYFSESEPAAFTSGLRKVLEVMLGLGVTVVAAAGNYSTSCRFLPAGFRLDPANSVPLISVGALNPNGSKAVFSDGGRWIKAWAKGAIMISTFPVDIQGSRTPELRMRADSGNSTSAGDSMAREREALDPDDYRSGFAAWSGTSFSAPLLAAHIARSLLKDKRTDPRFWLNDPGADAAKRRVLAALADLDWPG
jgi:subtilisin family serine protease